MRITNHIRLKVLGLALLAFSQASDSLAAQSFRVNDGDTVTVDISARELTRIAVSGDGRLDKVFGAAGVIEVMPDLDRGEVFIRPSSSAPAVLSFFAVDDTGGTYTIVATQRNIPSETILLEPARRQLQMQGAGRDRSIPIVERVKMLMKGMANGDDLEGYYREDVEQVVPLWHETKIRLEQYYETIDLFGEVYRIENVSPNLMTFHESEFLDFGDKVLAVALDTLALKPGESTKLYVVRRSSAEG